MQIKSGPRISSRRAEVSSEFIEEMLKIYTAWLKKAEKVFNDRGRLPHDLQANASRLIQIVNKKTEGLRSGYEYEITRLHCSPYKQFYVHTHKNTKYLVGISNPVTIKDYRTKKVLGELGSYRVFLPVDLFSGQGLEVVHLIPERNPKSVWRHPHHHTRGDCAPHPLERTTGNCWGSYSPTILGLVSNPDIPELYRQLYGHLSTYGNLPPVKMNELDFDIETIEVV